MAIIVNPKQIGLPPMLPDCSDYHSLEWTEQPGGDGVLHVSILGPAPETVLPPEVIKATENAQRDAMPEAFAPLAETPDGASRVALRDYQKDCVDAILASWKRGVKAPLVVLPTGAGKTVIAASVMERAYLSERRSLFIAHRKELLDQTAQKIQIASSQTSPPSVGVVQASRNQLGRDITVASMQTLSGAKRLAAVMDAGPYDVIFVDEAHHAPSKSYRKILDALRERFGNAHLAGLTATPARSDGLALDSMFDEVCYQRSVFEMIDLEYLVPIRAKQPHLDIRLEQVKTGDTGDYDKDQLSKVLNTAYVNRAMVEAWREFGEDRKTLLFAVDVAHATALAEEFQDAGYASDVVFGSMKDRERSRALKRFTTGETKILCGVEVALEGYDEPSIEGIFFARPTQSQALCIQALGRGLRLYPGKRDCLVIDPVGNLQRHALVQLASLAGFDPVTGQARKKGLGDPFGDDIEHSVEVQDVEVRGATDIELRRPRRANYDWRETSLGWALLIPNIGYYMVAWDGPNRTRATVRFYDQRPGRRDEPARSVIAEPIDFDMAFGLVEGEMDRFFRARNQRGKVRMKSGAVVDSHAPPEFADNADSAPAWTFVDLDEGLDEDVHVSEALMMKEAHWRERPMTARQRELILKLGGKKTSLPSTAGEASGLIAVLLIERDAKMRLPPSEKQVAYLRLHGLPMAKTKGEAARRIWPHRKAAMETKEKSDELRTSTRSTQAR